MATQQWLQQVRDDPLRTQTFSVSLQPSVTVFRVPEIPRARSPDYHKREELQLGLHNRSLQTSGSQLLKLDIARCLHAKLLTTSRSWEAFATDVVGDVQTARGHYQGYGEGLSDDVVPFLLALDALFLVVLFRFRYDGSFFLKRDWEHMKPRLDDFWRTFNRSDMLLLENQLPMYLLTNVVAQLSALNAAPTVTEMDIQIKAKNKLDHILKVAVRELYPLGHPYESESKSCFSHLHIGYQYENANQRFYNYLSEKYPHDHPNQSLQNCKHVLDCVYVVVCGHSLPYSRPQRGLRPSTRLDTIPSVSRLQEIGITITNTASSVNKIELSGWGYVTSARLSLPKVDIYDGMETEFHNLALHEQLNYRGQHGDWRFFLLCMASLSNNHADLALLVDHGVMNQVGDNTVGMWNRILKGVDVPVPSSFWIKCYQDIHSHRRNWLKGWRHQVWVLFFSKPWTFVALLGAIAILFLTAVQTWFTVVNAGSRRWHWPNSD